MAPHIRNDDFSLSAYAPSVLSQTVPAARTTDAPEALETIAVTSQKRSENLQDVLIAVSAVSAAQIESAGIRNVPDLPALVPGLQVPAVPAAASPHLRGVGSAEPEPGIESSVAIYVDDVYLASPSASFLSFNNIAQIEVLKGSQSTLFARNATGGVIPVTTRTPTNGPTADFQIGYRVYDTVTDSAYISMCQTPADWDKASPPTIHVLRSSAKSSSVQLPIVPAS